MSQRKREQLQKNAGLVNLPTDLTYELRMAVEGYGEKKFLSWGYQWKDKPHRLVHTACAEIEALTVENAKLRAEVERLRTALAFYADQRSYKTATVQMSGHFVGQAVAIDAGAQARKALEAHNE